MRILLFLIVLGVLGYGGWTWYQQSSQLSPPNTSSSDTMTLPELSLQDPGSSLTSISSVLGASISRGVGTATELINDISGGATEPIINNAINNFQSELSKLPEDQVKKIQYNYCRAIVEEYESTNL